eukprot:364194-Chlamydomonas_euryale.AAC.1
MLPAGHQVPAASCWPARLRCQGPADRVQAGRLQPLCGDDGAGGAVLGDGRGDWASGTGMRTVTGTGMRCCRA